MFGVAGRWMTGKLVFASTVSTLVMSGPVIMISIYANLPDNAIYSALLWPSLLSIVPMILYHTLPVLAAVAIIWCYGRFASEGALVVLHMAGRSPFSVRAPGLVVAVGAALLGYFFSCFAAPNTARHLHDVLYAIRNNLTPSLLKVGAFNTFGKGNVVFVARRTSHNTFSDVFILKQQVEDDDERAYAAHRAVFERRGEEQVAVLLDGSLQAFSQKRKEIKVINFENLVLPMAKTASVARAYRTVDELSAGEFLRERADTANDAPRARSWMREALNRFAIPGLVLPHVLLGLELLGLVGAMTDRKRDSVPLICAGLSLIHFVEVFVIEQVGANLLWIWVVGALIAAELAAAASLVALRTGRHARSPAHP